VVAVVAAACSSTSPSSSPGHAAVRPEVARARLIRAVDADRRAHPSIPGEAVSVRAPGLAVEVARGRADLAARTPLTVATPFRIASVTKTFLAAAVLRMVERGAFALDRPVADLVAPATAAQLAQGGYRPDRITVRMLLDHTAGLFDYATSARYDRANVDQPQRHWTRAEQLALAMQGRRVAAPGRRYHYSDTGYVLLGEILERAAGRPLAAAVRDALGFERLGLRHTFWETFEPPPGGSPPRAHQYYGTTFDNATLDASSDLYGGGGLVSTVGDLSRFFRALFDGRVFEHDATLDAMLTVSKPGHRSGAALGIFATDIGGERCWGHPGYWGSEAYYCPRSRLAFALTINQADESGVDTAAVERAIVRLAR
jgi:D-alanyl-D-alanine carboxypeptidase